MPNHRIERFLPAQTRLPKLERSAQVPSGFVLLPTCFVAKHDSTVGLLESAYAAARQQLAAKRRQKQQEAFLWN